MRLCETLVVSSYLLSVHCVIIHSYYAKASIGFSKEVDEMLIDTSGVKSCPERNKQVILLLDEMHIREDLAFDINTLEDSLGLLT